MERSDKQRSPGSVDGILTYYHAPAGLQRRIRARIRFAAPAKRGWRLAAWFAPALGFACASLVAANVAVLASLPSKDDRIAGEVVGSHLRALMTERAIDVESSDQHTVKPWYTGRLDFSPPVTDFAPQGFTLAGGRVDYVDGRTVAALVYKHRRHMIDVFIWPEAGGGPAVEMQRRGYNLLHWQRDGVTYWVASDVEARELRALEQLISQAAP